MDKIGATEPLKISIVSILYQIVTQGVLVNIHNPILGINDSYWRIIVATLGNAIIMTIVVFIIDKPGIKQPLQKID